jgi:exonuclease SbcD
MSIKILHTADWHLGKKLFKVDRTDEQKLFLDWLLSLIKKDQIDFLLVSGDIFDTPQPPNTALKLYFDFLSEISTTTECQTVIIGGNHDSGHFLEAPLGLFESRNIHVTGKLKDSPEEHHLQLETKNKQKILFTSLPYFRHHEFYPWSKEVQLEEADLLQGLRSLFKSTDKFKDIPRVLLAHHLFGNYESAGSEQVVSLSGLDSIPLGLLKDQYDYVALGHIHKTQKLKESNPMVIYPGSPIPMRFSESQKKVISQITFNQSEMKQEYVEIPVFRKIIQLKTDESNVLEDIFQIAETHQPAKLETLMEVQVKVDAPKSGLIDQIRNILKNKNINLISYNTLYDFSHENKNEHKNISDISTEDLFKNYFKEKYSDSDSVPKELLSDFKILLEDVRSLNNEN